MKTQRRFKKTLLAVAIAAPVLWGTGAQAQPDWGGVGPGPDGLHQEFYNNFENVWATIDSCTPQFPCYIPNFDGANNDPAGWARRIANGIPVNDPNAAFVFPDPLGVLHTFDATVTGQTNLREGDVFAGIINVQEIRNLGLPTWFAALDDQFTGYFAQQVVEIVLRNDEAADEDRDGTPLEPGHATRGGDVGLDHTVLGAVAVDPWGILAAGEMFRLYEEEGAGVTPFESNGSILDDITKATDGNFWASLGTGLGQCATDPDNFNASGECTVGYAYSHVDLLALFENLSAQEAFLGLNLIALGEYNKGPLTPINDVNEDEVGGSAQPPITGACLPGVAGSLDGDADLGLGLGGPACNHFVGTNEIEANPDSILLGGFSPWFFASNDPMINYRVPEPATVALFGMGLLGLGGLYRRRRST